MPGIKTYWRTLKYLKPIQFYGRLQLYLVKPSIDLKPAPPLRQQNGSKFETPIKHVPGLLGPDRFHFLNKTCDLSDHGWDDPSHDKLYRYNLHYFNDLNSQHDGSRLEWHRFLLQRWVNENPPAKGTGWEPYPTSLRIVNWIKWALKGNVLPVECMQSLAVQTRWLSRRLEIHLLGNHLFANAKALIFAGLYFWDREADNWLKRGQEIIDKELHEQILPDGGHFERSAMYHSIILEDMLDLVNIYKCYGLYVTREWLDLVNKMRFWLMAMCHPDGEISFFNDSALGISATLRDINDYAARLNINNVHRSFSEPITRFKDSGYVRAEAGDAVVLINIGSVGPDYLPAHTHADTLSFELSFKKRRIFVNSGTSVYGNGPERLVQRGTAVHNTVMMDNMDSSEVWDGFRVGRRARVTKSDVHVDQDGRIVIYGEHDGYSNLPGNPIHRRTWTIKGNDIYITDEVSGRGKHLLNINFHIYPDNTVVLQGNNKAIIYGRCGDELCSIIIDGTGDLGIYPSEYYPEFGLSLNNSRITYKYQGEIPVRHVSHIHLSDGHR